MLGTDRGAQRVENVVGYPHCRKRTVPRLILRRGAFDPGSNWRHRSSPDRSHA
jgi:hypothetical protein